MPLLSSLLNPEKRFNSFLFKGKPKSGKSIAAASFPRPMFYFDFDERIQSIAEFYSRQGDNLEGIEFESYMGKDYEKFDSKLDEIRKFPGKYKTVVFDSLTNFAELALTYFVYLRGQHNSGSTRKEQEYKHKGVVDLLEVEDYGGEDRAIMNTLRMLLTLKCHVVVIAHTIEVSYKDLLGNVHTSQSLLTGGRKIAEKIPSIFNEVYHFHTTAAMRPTDPNEFYCNTAVSGVNWAGTIYKLPQRLDFANKNFFNVLQDKLKGSNVELAR